MTNSFRDENPYESPIVAEVVERPKKRPKALPVVAMAMGLLFVLMLSIALAATIHPAFFVMFPLALIGTLVFMFFYDIRRWFLS